MAAPGFHKQLNRHDPDGGVFGDCYRTCIAILCGLHPGEVPNFGTGGTATQADADREAATWLADRGMGLITHTVTGTIGGLPDIMRGMTCQTPGVHYILSGQSRTGVNHSVIACDAKIVWDPSLTDAAIVGPMSDDCEWGFIIEFLVFAGGVASSAAERRIAGLVRERDELLELLHRQTSGILDAVRPGQAVLRDAAVLLLGLPDRREAA